MYLFFEKLKNVHSFISRFPFNVHVRKIEDLIFRVIHFYYITLMNNDLFSFTYTLKSKLFQCL